MNWDMAKKNWMQFQHTVRREWRYLTDDHLNVIAGQRDVLASKIQEVYGISDIDAEQQITWFEQCNKRKDDCGLKKTRSSEFHAP